jgi:hypothetical protein
MRHAGEAALDELEPILVELRKLPGLRERKRGAFYIGSIGFLHFHEDPAGFFADLKEGVDFVRMPANNSREVATLLRRAAAAVKAGVKRR